MRVYYSDVVMVAMNKSKLLQRLEELKKHVVRGKWQAAQRSVDNLVAWVEARSRIVSGARVNAEDS